MKDTYGRNINYARLSVTDRCNLNCIYCDPVLESNSEILSADEFITIAKALARIGIKKIRITGGEPLVRKDLEKIIAGIANIDGIDDIPMTTNAVGLSDRLDGLKSAGLTRINISLDTLKEDRFKFITKSSGINSVLKSIDKAIEMGIDVKINTVLMKGINDDEINDIMSLAKDLPIAVRFIELMPIGKLGQNTDMIVRNEDIINNNPNLQKIGRNIGSSSDRYRIDGYKGEIGFISPISHKFCGDCNRIRITSDGKLRLCIGSNSEYDLLSAIKANLDLSEIIKNEITKKPFSHNFEDIFTSNRNMNRIGG